MDDGGFQEFACVVYGCPEVLGAGDEDGGVCSGADVLFKGVEAEVTAGGVMREDAGGAAGPAGVMFAEDAEEVGEWHVCGGVVVQ